MLLGFELGSEETTESDRPEVAESQREVPTKIYLKSSTLPKITTKERLIFESLNLSIKRG